MSGTVKTTQSHISKKSVLNLWSKLQGIFFQNKKFKFFYFVDVKKTTLTSLNGMDGETN